MAPSPPEIQTMLAKDPLLLPTIALGTLVAGCSYDFRMMLTCLELSLCCLCLSATCCSLALETSPSDALRAHCLGNWTQRRSSCQGLIASKMACAASSKYLGLTLAPLLCVDFCHPTVCSPTVEPASRTLFHLRVRIALLQFILLRSPSRCCLPSWTPRWLDWA